MAASGIFYTFEIINSRFPDIFINLAFVLLGTALGSRLNGLKLKELNIINKLSPAISFLMSFFANMI